MTTPILPDPTDDPRLTAYVLGELNDHDRAEIDALLKSDPKVAQVVDELRLTANWLTSALRAEEVPGLTLEHRLAIEDGYRHRRLRFVRWRTAALAVAAAGTMLAVGFSLGRVAQRPGASLAQATHESLRGRSAGGHVSLDFSPADEAIGVPGPRSEPAPSVAVPSLASALPESATPAADPAPLSILQGSDGPAEPAAGAVAAPLERESKTEALSDMASAGQGQPDAFSETAPPPASIPVPPGPAGNAPDSMFGFRGAVVAPGSPTTGRTSSAGAQATTPMFESQLGSRSMGRAPGGAPAAGTAGVSGPTVATAAAQPERFSKELAQAQKDGSETLAESLDVQVESFELARRARFSDGSSASKGQEKAGDATVDEFRQQAGLGKNELDGLEARAAGFTRGLSADTRFRAKVEAGKKIVFEDEVTGDDLGSLSNNADVVSLAVSPNNHYLATSDADQTLNFWDLRKGQVVQTLRVEKGTPPQVSFDAEGRVLLSGPDLGQEAYDRLADNPFFSVLDQPLATFSADVDTASYANVRRFLQQGQLPPRDAVRIEELVNYFRYDDPEPSADEPFSVSVEVARTPWNATNRLARVALRARDVHPKERPPTSLVFLVDVSGSMEDEAKLPLVRDSLRMLLGELGKTDSVAIVTYADDVRTPLAATPADRKEEILAAINGLSAAGGTNGAAGLEAAYKVAMEHKLEPGLNRVILCTDGDFNVGEVDRDRITNDTIARAKAGVFLTVLGFGDGNLKDSFLEQLADKADGVYSYIDSAAEARRALVDRMGGALVPLARDVKLQVEFNPRRVDSYRLLGYENRMLQTRDFRDDSVDAGEIGAGHSVVALYELVPAQPGPEPAPRALKYQQVAVAPATKDAEAELLTVSLRYRKPDAKPDDPAEPEIQRPVTDAGQDLADASVEFRFSAAVAEFGLLLRHAADEGSATLAGVAELAESSLGADPSGLRREFVTLVRRAAELSAPAQEIVPLAAPVP